MASYTYDPKRESGYSDGSRCDHPDNVSAQFYWPTMDNRPLACAKGRACYAEEARTK